MAERAHGQRSVAGQRAPHAQRHIDPFFDQVDRAIGGEDL
jgi:hypothetical protein